VSAFLNLASYQEAITEKLFITGSYLTALPAIIPKVNASANIRPLYLVIL
jgi:hypothetical protein